MRKEITLWSCAALLLFGSLTWAGQPRPYIGLNLDATPLPELLTKHLRLEAGQGVRINNIMEGSPADRAGLERDDLVVTFEGQKITNREQVVNAVRQASVGATVTLEVIHLGQRQTVRTKLESAPESAQWRYPAEADIVTAWRPGKVFKIGPDGQNTVEVPFDKLSGDLKKFFKESYTYHHSTGGEDYTITIEGDPADPGAQLIVESGDQKYSATVGDLGTLPEKYRAPAREAVQNARTSMKTDIRIELPEAFGPDIRQKLFRSLPRPDMNRLLEQKDQALEKLQGQMDRLQQQMKELEERNRVMIEKWLQREQTNKTPESQTLPPS